MIFFQTAILKLAKEKSYQKLTSPLYDILGADGAVMVLDLWV